MNFSRYNNPEYDALFDAEAMKLDEPKRLELLEKYQTLVQKAYL